MFDGKQNEDKYFAFKTLTMINICNANTDSDELALTLLTRKRIGSFQSMGIC